MLNVGLNDRCPKDIGAAVGSRPKEIGLGLALPLLVA
jgi:hypothetical protein